MKAKIRPSERINRRYLLLSRGSEEEVKKLILDYLGILGWGKAAPEFVKTPKGFVLAIDREEMDNVRAAFEMSSSEIKILRVSGTLKGLEK